MTEKEMRELKVGDIIVDLEVSKNFNEKVLCKITETDTTGIVINSLSQNYKISYPHRLNYNCDSYLIEFNNSK